MMLPLPPEFIFAAPALPIILKVRPTNIIMVPPRQKIILKP